MTPVYKLSGTVHITTAEESVGKAQGFTRAILVVETSGQYPQLIRLEAHNKKCALIKDLVPQQEVEVEFTLKGKCFQGTYFTNPVIRSVKAGAVPSAAMTNTEATEVAEPVESPRGTNESSAAANDDADFPF